MTRKRIEFWLDDKRDEDVDLYNLIAALKKKRKFSRAIREGLRTWANTEHPEQITAAHPKTDSGAGGLDNAKVEKLIELLELTITNQKANGGYTMQSLQPANGLKPLASFKPLAAPTFDDDEIPALLLNKSKTNDSAMNFVACFKGL